MPVGKEKKIFAPAIHIKSRIMLHHFKIQSGKKIGATQRPARVATLRPVHHSYYVAAHLYRHIAQLLKFHLVFKILAKVTI